jgi:hypothetical protein
MRVRSNNKEPCVKPIQNRSLSFRKSTLWIAALCVAAAPAFAQAPSATPAQAADGQWHYLVGLYGWFPAISGSLTVRPVGTVPIDVSFSDLWDHLKMNLTGHFEAGKGPFGFGVDAFYVRLAAPVVGEIPDHIGAAVNLRQFIGEGFGYYRLFQGGAEFPWKLEAIGGVRYWDTNTRLETDITNGTGKTVDWADGFGGLRVEFPLGDKLILMGRGDVGAGGARLDWSASGDLALRLGKGWISGAGYRTLNVDYDKAGELGVDRRLVDLSYSGPRVWIAYAW